MSTYPWMQIVNIVPIIQFQQLYLDFYNNKYSKEVATKLLDFLTLADNIDVLNDNARYQLPLVPPPSTISFLQLWKTVTEKIEYWLKEQSEINWTIMWEYVNDIHTYCLPANELVYLWYDSLSIPLLPNFQWDKIRFFFSNPYTYSILLSQSNNVTPPYPSANFSYDWLIAQQISDIWICVNNLNNIVYQTGVAYENLMICLNVLKKWCSENIPDIPINTILENTTTNVLPSSNNIIPIPYYASNPGCNIIVYPLVNYYPIIEFIQLYDKYERLINTPNIIQVCQELLDFLTNMENIDVMSDNARYQNTIEITDLATPTFTALWSTVVYLLQQRITNPNDTSIKYELGEMFGNFYYYCFDPFTAINYWKTLLNKWNPNSTFYGPLDLYFKFLPKFFESPYNYSIIQNNAKNPPYPNATFNIDWLIAIRTNYFMIHLYRENGIFNQEYPLYKAAHNTWLNLHYWIDNKN